MKVPLVIATAILGFSGAVVAPMAFAAEPANNKIIVVEIEPDFPTSVKKQLQKGNVLETLKFAPEVSVQMIKCESEASPRSMINEAAIKVESKSIVLTDIQRGLLMNVFNTDVEYKESMAPCLCVFRPQLRVAFVGAIDAKKKFDILVSTSGHGEIRAFLNGQCITFAASRDFYPALGPFLRSTFPGSQMLNALEARLVESAKR